MNFSCRRPNCWGLAVVSCSWFRMCFRVSAANCLQSGNPIRNESCT